MPQLDLGRWVRHRRSGKPFVGVHHAHAHVHVGTGCGLGIRGRGRRRVRERRHAMPMPGKATTSTRPSSSAIGMQMCLRWRLMIHLAIFARVPSQLIPASAASTTCRVYLSPVFFASAGLSGIRSGILWLVAHSQAAKHGWLHMTVGSRTRREREGARRTLRDHRASDPTGAKGGALRTRPDRWVTDPMGAKGGALRTWPDRRVTDPTGARGRPGLPVPSGCESRNPSGL